MLAAAADSSRHDTPGPIGVLQTRMSAFRPLHRYYARELRLPVPGARPVRQPGARDDGVAPRLARVSLSIGIVGLPNVGKSTLFNALTRATVLASNYPFATIEPNVGIVGIPDPRLDALAGLYDSAKIVPATVRFVDIAGLVRGASQGQGLGNQFLAHIRETDAICQVVRVFTDADVSHVDGGVAPERDIETVVTELILADLQTLEKAAPRLAKEAKFSKDAGRLRAADAAAKAEQVLDGGTTLFAGAASAGIDVADLRELQLLTAKPFVYAFNEDEAELADSELRERLAALVAPAESVFLDAKTEAELAELPEDEAAELLSELGLGEPGLAQLARAGFTALGLSTFLTAGPKEARAWTIPAGATAPEAAGVIHTDFQRGFIKAEVVSFDDLMAAGSMAAARAAGKVRIEGRDYVMRDGDVVEFRFNV
jgi:ribosome-binding ATPase